MHSKVHSSDNQFHLFNNLLGCYLICWSSTQWFSFFFQHLSQTFDTETAHLSTTNICSAVVYSWKSKTENKVTARHQIHQLVALIVLESCSLSLEHFAHQHTRSQFWFNQSSLPVFSRVGLVLTKENLCGKCSRFLQVKCPACQQTISIQAMNRTLIHQKTDACLTASFLGQPG